MARILRSGALAIGLFAVAVPFAQAEPCAKLVGKTQCFTFIYSSGGSNQYTGTFSAGGVFNLGGTSPGTYTCAGGKGLVEVNYDFGGFETQQWYAQAGLNGNFVSSGFGKSITNGYMYKLSSVAGACALAADLRAPGANQNE